MRFDFRNLIRMKTKLLFVQESLRLAGSEKSLVTLLNNLNPDLYEIDLQLMSYGGELENELPAYVNLLPVFKYKKYTSQSFIRGIFSIRKNRHLHYLIARLKYSLKLRKGTFSHMEKAQYFWESAEKVISAPKKEYDVAIAFAQGFPTFYVADKIQAKKKISWINAIMGFKGENKEFQEKYYQKFDSIVCITNKVKEAIQVGIPSVSSKLTVLSNIIDYQEIIKAANSKKITFSDKEFNILTVGRLNNSSKGMDIAIKACKILQEKTRNFHWYFLGEGYYKEDMTKFVVEHQLQQYVTLLGSDSNPYPYFKAANLYVQTSRNEGYGRTIAEARMLNVPLITTNFDGVDFQIQHLKNGIITEMDADSVANGVEDLMKNKELYNIISTNLKLESKENKETVEFFDGMIEELLKSDQL